MSGRLKGVGRLIRVRHKVASGAVQNYFIWKQTLAASTFVTTVVYNRKQQNTAKQLLRVNVLTEEVAVA